MECAVARGNCGAGLLARGRRPRQPRWNSFATAEAGRGRPARTGRSALHRTTALGKLSGIAGEVKGLEAQEVGELRERDGAFAQGLFVELRETLRLGLIANPQPSTPADEVHGQLG